MCSRGQKRSSAATACLQGAESGATATTQQNSAATATTQQSSAATATTDTFVASYCWTNQVNYIFNKKRIIINHLVMFSLPSHQYPAHAHILTHTVSKFYVGLGLSSVLCSLLGLGSDFKMMPIQNSGPSKHLPVFSRTLRGFALNSTVGTIPRLLPLLRVTVTIRHCLFSIRSTSKKAWPIFVFVFATK